MNDIGLFVRSYYKDYGWLAYSVQSMKKYLTGIKESVLVIPSGDPLPHHEIVKYFTWVVYSTKYTDCLGYIGQQLDKLEAHLYLDNEYILFSDSDCIYTGPFDPNLLYFHEGTPILRMIDYNLLPPKGKHWQPIVAKYLHFTPTHEFMRTIPLLYSRRTLDTFKHAYPELVREAVKITNFEFSEFNMLGAFAYKHQHPYYYTEETACLPCKQFWSWSGLTELERREIQGLLK